MAKRAFIAIDLKSFYASVECVERGLNPLTTNLVVADISRTEKTICLAASPSLKTYGIKGRARLFEVVQRIKEVNSERQKKAPQGILVGKSYDYTKLCSDNTLAVDYLVAPPQMAHYMKVSADIYNIYLRYIAPEDIHVYSIDEVFIDATSYLETYGKTVRELAVMLIKEVLKETGVTATAGIGTNLYLCKVAMDIVAKKIPPDEDGVRIAELDEASYRRLLWNHTPLTDFWRVGKGYANRLEQLGLFTMGDIARCSVGKKDGFYNEELLYKTFGVNAELLIDHAWGYEPCLISDIKKYKPENNSIGSGQVLRSPYSFEKGELIVREMTDLLTLDLVDKGLVTDQMVLTVGYDTENVGNNSYSGDVESDRYGRKVPKSSHGSVNIGMYTSSTKIITEKVIELYKKIVNRKLTIRRISVTANHIVKEGDAPESIMEQMDLFTDYGALQKKNEEEQKELDKEKSIQKAVIGLKKKYGKNAVLKGMNFKDGATTIERNGQVGGHKA